MSNGKDEGSFWGAISRSFTDAASLKNSFRLIYRFFAFAVLSAFPYLIFNLNKVGIQSANLGLFEKIFQLLLALLKTIWIGFWLACSTVWDVILHKSPVIGNLWGDIIYLLIVVPGILFTAYQPASFIANIIDLKEGRHYNIILAAVIALLIAILACAGSYYFTNGETISSGVTTESFNVNQNSTQVLENETSDQDDITISIDMLTGDGG